MENLNKKYFGKKIIVTKSQNKSSAKLKYKINLKNLIKISLFVGLSLLIFINIVFILKGMVNFV